MSAIWPALACMLVYFIGYRFYSARLSRRLFRLDDRRETPAHRFRNDVDYLPTSRYVLFGHHFASITGLSPMLGPAIAVIWGWLPAMIWVVLGAVFIGCVHDFSALVLSIRANGSSIGKVCEGVIGARAKGLFLALIFFGVALAMGVFTLVIARLFAGNYGTAVIPSGGLMLVAAAIGWLAHKRGIPWGRLTIVGFALQLTLVCLGSEFPIEWSDSKGWMVLLLIYALAASVLPVWSLLQPRDFLNSLLLYLGLVLCYIGFFAKAPEFAAPAFEPEPPGAPPLYPFVFITIACGAASGFHALVSSGTTAKQLNRESDARFVGYGGMLGESLLGLLAVLATTAGVAASKGEDARTAWSRHYADWHAASGLGAKMGRFIDGAAGFMAELGVPMSLAVSLVAVIVVSFALTTLDSATRLLRYNVEEVGASLGWSRLTGNRYFSSLVAVAAIAGFAFYQIDGKPAGMALWAIFGTVNQLLAGLTLLTVTLWLRQRGRNPWYTGLPMAFMLITTAIAMVSNLKNFSNSWTFQDVEGKAIAWPLLISAIGIAILGTWMIVEAVLAMARRDQKSSGTAPS
ncbi:MAG: carbon starvation protein A [Planctomycetota bacterium]